MIDTHCHLTHDRLLGERGEIVSRARSAGLTGCVTVGTGADDGSRALELSEEFPGFVHCTAGIDPFSAHRAGDSFPVELERLRELLQGGRFCALGEVGLDYHYELDPPSIQAHKFESQLDLAQDLDLPVVIHVREAHSEMAAILRAHPDSRGVIHSFSAAPAEAERYLELGWMLSFNGVLTFKNAASVRESARIAPSESLLVETDSPYLAPVPLRGKRCEPAFVAHTLERLAELRSVSLGEIVASTTENARRLFRLGAA